MALWRVLDLYKRDASRRGQAPAKPTHLNSDKKVNSKPSETGHSPLNRLANRPVILRSSAYFEFHSFYIFRAFFTPFCFGRCFSCAVLFYYRKNHFPPLFEYDFTPWKRQKNHAKLILTHSRFFIGVWYNHRRYNDITFWYISVTSMSLCLPNSRGIVVTQSNSQRSIARIASRVFKSGAN